MIIFDPVQFKIDYPQFIDINDNKLSGTFNFEAMVIGEVVSSLFCDDDTKYYWLCIVLAHILTVDENNLTGKIASVTQGSESVGMTNNGNAAEWEDFWGTTVYGRKIIALLREFLSGGHYISDGKEPYLGDSMDIWSC